MEERLKKPEVAASFYHMAALCFQKDDPLGEDMASGAPCIPAFIRQQQLAYRTDKCSITQNLFGFPYGVHARTILQYFPPTSFPGSASSLGFLVATRPSTSLHLAPPTSETSWSDSGATANGAQMMFTTRDSSTCWRVA